RRWATTAVHRVRTGARLMEMVRVAMSHSPCITSLPLFCLPPSLAHRRLDFLNGFTRQQQVEVAPHFLGEHTSSRANRSCELHCRPKMPDCGWQSWPISPDVSHFRHQINDRNIMLDFSYTINGFYLAPHSEGKIQWSDGMLPVIP